MIRTFIALFLFACTISARLYSQTHDHAPRETLGTVTFSTSCEPAVQPAFNRAVALMHSFQFGPATQAFHGVLAADPACAIADWGIALSIWGNPFAGSRPAAQMEQGRKAVEEGRALLAKTERERAYINAVGALYVVDPAMSPPKRLVAYERSMAALHATHPEDNEATIFYALALAAAADPADQTYAKQLKAGALLESLFAKYPNHPGLAHYIIHAYDVPALAPRAAEAARRYGEIAPSTPHALHMPSHTFTRVGDWQSSIATNTASAAAARAANQPADVLHASDYMVYAYLQTAQDESAKRLMESSAQTFLSFDPAHTNGAAPVSAAFFAHAAIPARYCLERRAWADAASLEPLLSPFPYADAITYFSRGLGAAHLGNVPAAQQAIAALAQIQDKLALTKEDYWVGQIEIQRRAVEAMVSFAEGHPTEALTGIRLAADMEDRTQLASVTPGPLVPAREMLADLLLQLGRPADALKEYEATLLRQPNRYWSLYGAGMSARQTGDRQKADFYFHKLITVAERADQPGRQGLSDVRVALAHE